MLRKGYSVAIVALSNGLDRVQEEKLQRLEELFVGWGLKVVWTDYLYRGETIMNGRDEEKGKEFMDFVENPSIKAIFDVSGGDLANGVLPYLDFEFMKRNPKAFFGYSDLTVMLNSLVKMTNVPAYLYQVKHLVECESRQKEFYDTFFLGKDSLCHIGVEWIQGESMCGKVMGGNIRCLLKLAGTTCFPDYKDAILFLEAYSGDVGKIKTYLNQLKMMGVFDGVSGILLGTFTEMDEKNLKPSVVELIQEVVNNSHLPIATTKEVGHGKDSKALIIGKYIKVKEI